MEGSGCRRSGGRVRPARPPGPQWGAGIRLLDSPRAGPGSDATGRRSESEAGVLAQGLKPDPTPLRQQRPMRLAGTACAAGPGRACRCCQYDCGPGRFWGHGSRIPPCDIPGMDGHWLRAFDVTVQYDIGGIRSGPCGVDRQPALSKHSQLFEISIKAGILLGGNACEVDSYPIECVCPQRIESVALF